MAEQVKIPGIGKLPKWGVWVGAGGVGVAIILYYRNKSSSSSAAAPTSTDQYPPDGTVGNPQDPYSTDPATGQTYGDESVGSGGTYGAYSSASGAYPWDGTYGNSSDPYSLDPATGQTYGNEGGSGGGGGGGGGGSGSGGPPFSTNAAWADWVIQQLQSNNPNANTGDIENAIGIYINGQPATPAQRTIIFDAIAIGGDPPVAGATGYPPKIASSPGGGGGGNATNPVTGLKATPGFTGIDVSWSASKDATSYTVSAPGASNSPDQVTGTSTRLRNEPHKKQVTISVLANPAAAGAKPATVTVTTQ